MKIQTNQAHRYSQSITQPEPVGTVEFDAEGVAEVTEGQYQGLLASGQDVNLLDQDGVRIPLAIIPTTTLDEAAIEEEFNLNEEVHRLNQLNLVELKRTAADLGVEAALIDSLQNKKSVIEVIVIALTTPIDTAEPVAVAPTLPAV